jgi:hypothetical protein
MKIKIFNVMLVAINVLISQEIPQESFDFIYLKKQFDVGQQWGKNTVFGPYRYNAKHKDSLENKLDFKYGVMSNNFNIGLYFISEAFLKNLYFNLYPRIVTDTESFNRFSGNNMDILRLGFQSGETDMAGVGYDDGKYILQYGRGRQSWSLGNELDLVISDDAPPFDYGMFGVNLSNINFRYFHGYLGKEDDYNRYIVGKGLEWSNKKSLIFSFSEILIYSGKNRSLDLSYLNPISSHLEIELNDRQNYGDIDNGNAIWQFSMDFLHNKNIRISSNFIIDELIFDRIEIDSGKVNNIAWSNRISIYSKTKFGSQSLFIAHKYVGENTFRHSSGYNNFVNRGRSLGHIKGNNFKELTFGYMYLSKKWIFDVSINSLIYGKRNLGNDNYGSYKPFQNNLFFPSGNESLGYFEIDLFYRPKSNIYFFKKVCYNIDNNINKNIKINIGVNLFFNNVIII